MFFKPKRLWVVLAGLLLASTIGLGTVSSYIRTAKSRLGESIRESVPVQFEIDRLKQMIDDLEPEIRANQKVAAQLEVEIEYLEGDIESITRSQSKAKTDMQDLRQVLETDRDDYVFAGQNFDRMTVEKDLAKRLDRFENAASQLATKQRIMQSRKQTLLAAVEKIAEYQSQRHGLMEKAAALEAELKLVELAKAAGTFEFDDSKLAKARELTTSIEKRIRTDQKLVQDGRQIDTEIPVGIDRKSIIERFDTYFDGE